MTCLKKEKEIELSLYNDVGTLASYNKYIEATKGDISVIYMDNAATTMHKPKAVIDAVVAAMSSMGNAGRGANEASLSASRIIYDTRERLAKLFGAENPKQIVFTMNSTESLNIAIKGLIEPGDHVITTMLEHNSVLRPLYEMEERGAKLTIIKADKQGNFSLEDMEAAITPKTKLLVLPFPNNPTGAVYTEASLAAVCRAVGDKPIFILCDDVYRGLCTRPCPDPAALPGLRERLLIAQSFSKPWAMTGWRIGYLMGSAPVIRKLTALHGHILTCVPSMLQAACETALETDTAPMRETYAKRRALVLRRLHAMGLCCPIPDGAFYAFPDIRAFGLCSEAFCLRLIAEAGVAAVPGSCFGTEGHVRISYCCGEQTLERGMDRLEAFLEKLKQERRT